MSLSVLEFFVLSFCSLYWEILFIRWVPSEVHFLGFFTNFVLMACFLGLGVGCLVTHWRRRLLPWFPLLALVLMLVSLQSRHFRITAHNTEVLFLDYREAWANVDIWVALGFFYTLIALTFACLGQEIGLRFRQFPSLQAYSINTLGSLAGVIGFSLLSWFSLPAYVWTVLGFLPMLWLLRGRAPVWLAQALCALACAGLVWQADRGAIWSPYHKISTSPLQMNIKTGNPYPFEANQKPEEIKVFPESAGFNVLVNGLFYQMPLALSDASIQANPLLSHLRRQYDIPYKIGSNDSVLVVGGGSGNDAAAALRNGARHVDVVDIDPELVGIGRARHPDKPYSDPRVHVFIDDARSFFKKQLGQRSYDKIAFGLLDSHVLTSSLSNIRIDSYVYTEQAFRDAARLLSPRGIMVVNFTIVSPKFADKLYVMLERATGSPPVVLSEIQRQVLGVTLVAGPGIAPLLQQVGPRTPTSQVPPSTDDWPFFYLLSRSIGSDYLAALGLILAISVVFVVGSGPGRLAASQAHFFWLGSAFMLLESRSVTTLALLFGSTWQVNSLVLCSVLLMIWVANWLVRRQRTPHRAFYFAGLFGSLLLAYLLVPSASAQGMKLATVLLTFLPIVFAGAIFSTSFAAAPEPDRALGMNILGCILGGALEYVSMITGFHPLWLLIGGLYGLAALTAPRA